jgi:hypothetical protein
MQSHLLINHRLFRLCVAIACAAFAPSTAHADVVADFENGINNGNWFGNVGGNQLQATGGDPGGYWNAIGGRGEPFFETPVDPRNPFAGDYVAKGVTAFSCDLRADTGFTQSDPDGRNVTLHLFWTNSGDYVTGIDAYFLGDIVPVIGAGWKHYAFDVPANSSTIPADWVVTEGDGTPGTDADWQYLMHNVDHVEVMFGAVGYGFPSRSWNTGLDNATLVTPEPTSLALLTALPLTLIRRRQRS